jgi:HEPN domain-containing protein
MLDHAEFARWLEAAEDEAQVAVRLVNSTAHNAVVLHSEQAAQLLVKGLLRGVGSARDAWGHSLVQLAERAVVAAGLELSDDLSGRLAVLERDYKPSRYPDALVRGTPRGSYGPDDADRARETLAALRSAVLAAWGRLLDEESQGGGGRM